MRLLLAGIAALALAGCGTAAPEPETTAYRVDNRSFFTSCAQPGAMENIPSCRYLVYTLVHRPF